MKILLVDDEREEREGISWLIKKYKYPLEIVQAANGKEALQCIEKYKIDILSLIILSLIPWQFSPFWSLSHTVYMWL